MKSLISICIVIFSFSTHATIFELSKLKLSNTITSTVLTKDGVAIYMYQNKFLETAAIKNGKVIEKIKTHDISTELGTSNSTFYTPVVTQKNKVLLYNSSKICAYSLNTDNSFKFLNCLKYPTYRVEFLEDGTIAAAGSTINIYDFDKNGNLNLLDIFKFSGSLNTTQMATYKNNIFISNKDHAYALGIDQDRKLELVDDFFVGFESHVRLAHPSGKIFISGTSGNHTQMLALDFSSHKKFQFIARTRLPNKTYRFVIDENLRIFYIYDDAIHAIKLNQNKRFEFIDFLDIIPDHSYQDRLSISNSGDIFFLSKSTVFHYRLNSGEELIKVDDYAYPDSSNFYTTGAETNYLTITENGLVIFPRYDGHIYLLDAGLPWQGPYVPNTLSTKFYQKPTDKKKLESIFFSEWTQSATKIMGTLTNSKNFNSLKSCIDNVKKDTCSLITCHSKISAETLSPWSKDLVSDEIKSEMRSLDIYFNRIKKLGIVNSCKTSNSL